MTSSDETNSKTAHWKTVRRLFHQARELPVEERREYLVAACQGDPGLRREVERLLAADAAAEATEEGFLESPTIAWLPRELEPGQEIGPFRVLSKLGAGSMGEVYKAERIAFRQDVALKVINASRVDSETLWRFEHERQILARLTHPNIARLIDGGTLEDGRPWFALEYVEGERIDHWCDARRYTIRQRVELFRKVCAAVDAAHSLAVVHRDLKPANILVTDGEPKLLDFGIAKILEGAALGELERTLPRWQDDHLKDETPSDQTSNPMTPLYASPEQAAPLLQDEEEELQPIGIRSDVYSLGVVLYELLTGHPVYSRTRPWLRVLEAVKNEVPRLPSAAVAIERERGGRHPRLLTPESVSTTRNTTPSKLRKELRGDLDAILLKALAKDPSHRYASVDRLSDDLRAHRRGFPVQARSDSLLYRTRKFIRRRRRPIALAIVLTLFAIGYWIVQDRAQRKIAEVSERHEMTEANLADLFTEIQGGLGGDALDADLTEIIAYQIEPAWLADRFETLGFDVEDTGNFAAAERLFRAAVTVHEAEHGPDHVGLPIFLNSHAGALGFVGQFEAAEQLYRRALTIYDQALGPDSYESSRTLNNLAALYQIWNTNFPKARPLLEQSLEIRRVRHRDEEPQVLAVRNNLAYQSLLEGRYEQAREEFRAVLADLERTSKPGGEDVFRQRMARITQHLAAIDLELGNPQEAEKKARRALRILREELLHWRVAEAETVFGASLAGLGRTAEAEFFLDQGLEIVRQEKGVHSTNTRDARLRYDRWIGEGTQPASESP